MKIKFLLIFIIGILIYFVVFNETGLINLYNLKIKQNELRSEVKILEKEIDDLKKIIGLLKTNKYYIEKYCRDNYKMLKKDEIVVRIEKK